MEEELHVVTAGGLVTMTWVIFQGEPLVFISLDGGRAGLLVDDAAVAVLARGDDPGDCAAALRPNGEIRLHGKVIGMRADIEFTGVPYVPAGEGSS
jgi:hypothetical protein